MFRKMIWILGLAAVLTACGAPSTPIASTPFPTLPSSTQQATATSVPPTATMTLVPPTTTPTSTPDVGATSTAATATAFANMTQTALAATGTPNIFYGSSDYTKRENWATLKLINDSGTDVSVKIGGPGFYTYVTVKIDMIIEVPWGDFWYEATIGKAGPFNGGFSITNSDKHSLIFERNKVRFLVP